MSEVLFRLCAFPHAYVGETADKVFLTVLDAGGQAYLAVVQKQ